MASLSQERKNDAFALPASAICSASPSSSCSSASGSKYIEHNVSKLDTLAGVAIKYGVEVADIKRINGLSTDLQMFAHKSLLIPLRGRHPPPSPIQSKALVDDRDVLDSFQSAKLKSDGSFITSSAMSTLQRYYGLTQHKSRSTPEGTEMMTVYRACSSPNLENESLLKSAPASTTQLRSHRSDNDLEQALLLDKSGDASDGEKLTMDKSVRRRQKTDNDPLITPEAAIEDDDKGLVTRIRRGLAPRSLLASLIDPEPVKQNTTLTEETSLTNSLLTVRKSSSNSSLQDSENDNSIWTYSKWTLKPDSVTRPIFSALPKQISVWRSKAALD
ncbi:uncharacterized protein LOC122043102 [Zingiber officinale]|uniref:uncharacterized protein LOC122043102 n=1 Tax=Zingiber officinale TaxID=94328 RepID=UPI001C4D1000|nr:uncharacterized protein LOC122043102 [Zingiber officinale]